MTLLRDLLLVLFALAMAPDAATDSLDGAGSAGMATGCGGVLQQGGLVICRGPVGTLFQWSQGQVRAGPDGWAMFGLRRDAPGTLEIAIRRPGADDMQLALAVAPRSDEFRVIEGLDCDKVDARTSEQKAHAARSWVKKQEAFSLFHGGDGALHGFVRPAEGRTSSPFGPARKYVGVSAQTGEPCEKVSVHRGYDIAAPTGTPVTAPAAGTIILADPELYYEGGTIFLDHGHGLVSVFMHLSEIDVAVGDMVPAGRHLGAVGNTGRTTGPHLHWSVKWRNAGSEDRAGDFYIDPELLLDLDIKAVGEALARQ